MCVSAERFSADSETNCCSHIMRLSQGNIDFCGMYSQGELRVLMLSLCCVDDNKRIDPSVSC